MISGVSPLTTSTFFMPARFSSGRGDHQGVPGAELFLLKHKLDRIVEHFFYLVGTMSDHNILILDLRLAGRFKNATEHWLPRTRCSTFGICERILVPFPAARTIAYLFIPTSTIQIYSTVYYTRERPQHNR